MMKNAEIYLQSLTIGPIFSHHPVKMTVVSGLCLFVYNVVC